MKKVITIYDALRHPVTILGTDFPKPDNLTNYILIFNSMTINGLFGKTLSNGSKKLRLKSDLIQHKNGEQI